MPVRKNSIDRVIDAVYSEANELDDLSKLSLPKRVVMLIHTGQAIIDNGGLRYFFERDFRGKPDYRLFVEAYRAIGENEAANILQSGIELFPFANAHRLSKKRNAFLDSFFDEDGELVEGKTDPFEVLSMKLCGKKSVWKSLRKFVMRELVRKRKR